MRQKYISIVYLIQEIKINANNPDQIVNILKNIEELIESQEDLEFCDANGYFLIDHLSLVYPSTKQIIYKAVDKLPNNFFERHSLKPLTLEIFLNLVAKDIAFLNKLEKANFDFDVKGYLGYTCLMYACVFGGKNIVAKLLSKVSIDSVNSEGMTAFMLAAHCGNYEIVELLLPYVRDINQVNKDNNTALMMVISGHKNLSDCTDNEKKIVEILLDNSADPCILDEYGWNFLMKAASLNKIDLIKLLTKEQIERSLLQQGLEARQNALIISAKMGHHEVIKYLLSFDQGEEDYIDSYGRNALCYAAVSGNLEAVKACMLFKNINVNHQDNDNITAISLASMSGNLPIVRFLKEQGADINKEDTYSWTPVMHAARKGYQEIVNFFIDNGANLEAVNKTGDNLLMILIQYHQNEIAKNLIDREIGINVFNIIGMTPLIIACIYDNYEIIELLLERKDSFNYLAFDNQNHSALDYALIKQDLNLVSMFKSHGITTNINTKELDSFLQTNDFCVVNQDDGLPSLLGE